MWYKKTIEDKCSDLEKALEDKDIQKIETAQNELQTAWYSVSQKLYAQEQRNPAETILNPDGSMFNNNSNN